jgi:hypothetical protein
MNCSIIGDGNSGKVGFVRMEFKIEIVSNSLIRNEIRGKYVLQSFLLGAFGGQTSPANVLEPKSVL